VFRPRHLFSTLRHSQAAAVAIFGAILFLPEQVGFELAGLPSMDKRTLRRSCAG
jgi:hypothetical protein